MRKQERKINKDFTYFIKNHIQNNIKEYLIISIIFLIGIVLGVIFINNMDKDMQNQINEYINNFVNALKTDYMIDSNKLLKNVIISNLILTIAIWLISMIAVIGIPIVYAIILFRGFLLGYTISSTIITLGIWKGILFNTGALIFQNIIYIPCIVALGVSRNKIIQIYCK